MGWSWARPLDPENRTAPHTYYNKRNPQETVTVYIEGVDPKPAGCDLDDYVYDIELANARTRNKEKTHHEN
jgi:hypothetical protein